MIGSGPKSASAPFLRLLFPLCLGVIIAQFEIISPSSLSQLFLTFPVLLVILYLFREVSFSKQHLWGTLLLIIILFLGIIRVNQEKISFPELKSQKYFVVLDDYPIEKEKTYQVVAQLINTDRKILIYLPKIIQVKSSKPGDILCFDGLPEIVKNDGNPFEFDYRSYLNNRKIGYRIFLKEKQCCFLEGRKRLNLYRRALIFRSQLIDCLDHSGIVNENVHLIASISLGARDEVDKETIQSFTNTGVIHVLAVSGMNVGLIFVILNFIFRFLKKNRAGYILHTLIMLSGIWIYALITGMSASILRAALMFTFVIIGNTFKRNSNIFNSLAVSAFFLIAWNPIIIMDVGFQLSYAAVLSIIIIQPYLYKQLFFKNWIGNQLWLLITVTFAAQIGTIPFTLLYFHQFPVYFWLANLFVIPLVTLILYLTFVVLFLSLISGLLTSVVAFILDWLVRLVLISVNIVEKLPHSVLRDLYPSLIQIFLVFMMGFLFFRYVAKRNILNLQVFFLSAIIFTLSASICSYRQLTRVEIVFFNIQGTRALAMTKGKEAVVVYDRCLKATEKLGYYMKPYMGERGINKINFYQLSDSLRSYNKDICIIGGFIYFTGIRLYVQPINENRMKNVDVSLCSDLVWLNGATKGSGINSRFPETKNILYHSLDIVEKDWKDSKFQKKLNLKKAILLTIKPTLPGNPNNIVCEYFD
jgi:competence protein ComEC